MHRAIYKQELEKKTFSELIALAKLLKTRRANIVLGDTNEKMLREAILCHMFGENK